MAQGHDHPARIARASQVGTAAYYERNADAFVARTELLDVSETRARFLAKLTTGASILDVGCGSGRDTEAFVRQGFRVTALDASRAMLEAMRRRCAEVVLWHQTVQQLDTDSVFEGICACASLLHVPRAELPAVLARLARALRPHGTLYVFFKHGTDERADAEGRYFNDQTEALFELAARQVPSLTIAESWLTGDLRPELPERWLNVLLTRRTEETP